jgi:hypothetical protein
MNEPENAADAASIFALMVDDIVLESTLIEQETPARPAVRDPDCGPDAPSRPLPSSLSGEETARLTRGTSTRTATAAARSPDR